MGKKLVSGPILTHVPEVWVAKIFFSKIWIRQSLDIMVSYHPCAISEKTNDPILRKLSDGRTDE